MTFHDNIFTTRYRYVEGTASAEGAEFDACAMSFWSILGRLAGEYAWRFHHKASLSVEQIRVIYYKANSPDAEFVDLKNAKDAQRALDAIRASK